jgi:hypothetical protein
MIDARVIGPAHAAVPPETVLGRLTRLVRENRSLVILIVAASVVRLLIMIAYRPALFFHGDSGSYILVSEQTLQPQATFAVGYSAFLKIFRPTGTVISVVAVQHLLGLVMAVAVYALLRHRGVRRWLACLAVVPILFDSLELVLEHAILVETLAMSLMVAAFVLLLWPRSPSTVASFIAGGLLIGAWVVRPQLLPVILVVGVYLAIRRIGWRPFIAFVLATGVPYATVQVMIGEYATPYTSNYVSFYARVAGFAKCDQITLTEAERALCPSAELSGHEPGWYIWTEESPGYPYRMNASNYPVLKQFAIDVVRQQPLDYLRIVGIETAAHFVDGIPLRREHRCTDELYMFPRTFQPGGPGPTCRAQLASGDFQWPGRPREDSPPANALTTAIEIYGSIVRTPRLVVLGVYVLVVAAAVVEVRRRRRERKAATATATYDEAVSRVGLTTPQVDGSVTAATSVEPRALARDGVALAIVCLAIIVLPTILFMYASRYALPAMPLLGIAAGMAGESLFANRARGKADADNLARPQAS